MGATKKPNAPKATAKNLVKRFRKQLGVSRATQPETRHGIEVGVTERRTQPKGKASVQKVSATKTKPSKKTKSSKAKPTAIKRLQKPTRSAPRDASDERRDFERAHASLHEREQRAGRLSRPTHHPPHGRPRRHANRRPSSRTPTLQFAPPTFAVHDNDKTTSRLVQETMHRVQQLDGIGQPNVAHPQASAWATLSETEFTATRNRRPATHNPWAVLGTEDDEPDCAGAPTPTPPLFSFAPASFAVTEDVDPDL
jgi:hypothetical protein